MLGPHEGVVKDEFAVQVLEGLDLGAGHAERGGSEDVLLDPLANDAVDEMRASVGAGEEGAPGVLAAIGDVLGRSQQGTVVCVELMEGPCLDL